jgi:hypothetical protein
VDQPGSSVGEFICLFGCAVLAFIGTAGFGFYQIKNPMTLGPD